MTTSIKEPSWRKFNLTAPNYIGTGGRTAHSTTVCGQTIWFMGGLWDGYTVNSGLYAWDFVTKEWSKFNFPVEFVNWETFAIYAHTATLINGRILFIGGFFGLGIEQPCLGKVFGFDVVLNEFEVVETYGANNRGKIANHSANFMYETNEIVVYGGECARDQHAQDRLFTLDVDTLTWTKLRWQGNAPALRGNHGNCLVEQRLYIFGGCGRNNALFNDTFILDMRYRPPVFSQPELNWVPRRRVGTYLFHYRGHIFMFGGKFDLEDVGNAKVRMHDLCRFSIAKQQWHQCKTFNAEPHPGRKANHKGVFVNNRALIFGGKGSSFRECLEIRFG